MEKSQDRLEILRRIEEKNQEEPAKLSFSARIQEGASIRKMDLKKDMAYK